MHEDQKYISWVNNHHILILRPFQALRCSWSQSNAMCLMFNFVAYLVADTLSAWRPNRIGAIFVVFPEKIRFEIIWNFAKKKSVTIYLHLLFHIMFKSHFAEGYIFELIQLTKNNLLLYLIYFFLKGIDYSKEKYFFFHVNYLCMYIKS